jgi:hypothetical protein
MKTTEEKRAAYVEAYHAAMADLVPDFDAAADKESGSPWCLVDFTDDIPDDFLIDKAIEHAIDHAPEIARLVAADLENADNMPRIILVDDGTYHIYSVNNCLDIFGRWPYGIDFEAIKTAFDRTKAPTGFEAFKRLAQSFEPITSLDDLYQKMLLDHPSTVGRDGMWSSDLPNFGGEDLAGNDGVWSWDEKRLIIGSFSGDLAIITREEYAERQQ